MSLQINKMKQLEEEEEKQESVIQRPKEERFQEDYFWDSI